jgi:hypothetical protein
MDKPRHAIIALDLEGVLISTAVSQFPRPGLYRFLEGCHRLGRVVLYTTVPPERVRPIAERLVVEGQAPDWFRQVEIVDWPRRGGKDLNAIPGAAGATVVLVDDMIENALPGQEAQCIEAAGYTGVEHEDDALAQVLEELTQRLAASTN